MKKQKKEEEAIAEETKNIEESDRVRDAGEWQDEVEEGRRDERIGGEQDGRGRKGG